MDMSEHEGMPDPEKIKEILDVISEKYLGCLNSSVNFCTVRRVQKQYAEAAAIFFKELKTAGMTDAQAFELTRQYM